MVYEQQPSLPNQTVADTDAHPISKQDRLDLYG
jgi:hypothetical protein